MLRGTIAVVIAGALMAAGCAGVDAPQHGATIARPAAEAAKFEQDRKAIVKRFLDPADPLRILIVCDMLLTGFDAPIELQAGVSLPRGDQSL